MTYSLLFLCLSADPGADVLQVFHAKCAMCHGADLKKPQGQPPFGFVLDLKRLAADKDKVIPGDPDNSNLWKLVASGNMPQRGQSNSPIPLTQAQKQVVKTWITAGCPEPV